MNFAHRKNLISIFFEPFIHFSGNKTFTGKGKEKTDSFLSLSSAQPAKRPTAARALSLALPRAQAAT